MPRFPSAEWMDEFCGHLEAHEDADEVAKALDGVYRFVIEPTGPLRQQHVYDVEIRPAPTGGSASRVEGDGADPRLTLKASYDRWRQLITGKLDIGMAVMLRRLRVEGDLRALTRDMRSARPLLDALGAVDTDWPEG